MAEGEMTSEQPRSIETLSEAELRQEVTTRIDNSLGKLLVSPVVDGTGARGYNRERNNSLECSNLRFVRVMDQNEEQKGVQLELLGLFNGYIPEFQKDDLTPADHRYYFIPKDSEQPAIISTESFVERAFRANPDAALKAFTPEFLEQVKDENTQKQTSKRAGLQDLRDAVAIVRGYDNFVREVINVTPKEAWGRAGLTD